MSMSEMSGPAGNRRPIAMSRWKASAIHFLLSAAIAGALVALMLLVWYPWPLFELAGGSGLVLILVGVDVVLGPLITLVIFKAGKKGLKFDLAVIAMLQLSALAYGVYAVYVVRPAYIVFNADRFDLVAAIDLDPLDLAKVTRMQFKHPPVDGPHYAAAIQPKDPAEKQKIFELALAGKDLQLFPQHYVAYEQEVHNVLKRARAIRIVLERDSAGAVARYLESSGRMQDSVKFVPLRARHGDASVLLDAASGKPLKIVLVDPW